MQTDARQYNCERIDEDVVIGRGRKGIKVHCPHYNYNRNIYSLEINRVCSVNYPNNQRCIVLELMIKEVMKEKKQLEEITREKSKLPSKEI